MADIISFPGETTQPLPPQQILEKAIEKGLSQVIVIGLADDGPYYAFSDCHTGNLVLQLEMFKAALVDNARAGDRK